MVFPFRINNIPLDGTSTLPALKYQGASYSLESVDGSSAGRNQQGVMIRDKISDKVKWQLEFAPCTQDKLSALLEAVKPASFDFTYPDPTKPSGTATKKFYVGARSSPVWKIVHEDGRLEHEFVNREVQLWGNITMNFIEM